jgi:hypothetical protein
MQTTSNCAIRARGAATVAVVTTAVALAVPWLWQVVADAGRAARRGVRLQPDEVLVALTAGAALAGLAWLVTGLLLELLALLPGTVGRSARRVAEVVTPALVRRVAGGLLGAGVAAGLAPGAAVAGSPPTPATVTVGTGSVTGALAVWTDPRPSPLPDPGFVPHAPVDRAPPPRQWTAPERGWVPEPPTVRAQPDVRVLSPTPRPVLRNRPPHEPPGEVVVHRGDTLWSVAARHLGPGATDAEVARAWPAWFEANRAVIGDDPDLLRPGQRLRPPDEVRS